MSFGKKLWSAFLALSTILTFIGLGLALNSQPSFAANHGDIFLSATNSTPPGHETDPHLGCPTYIYLWGSDLASSSGNFSVDGIAPSGNATGEPTSGGTYTSDQAWPNDNADASIPPTGGAPWSYNTSSGGDQVIARILTSQLIANALKNGDRYQSPQGFHFKVQFTQPLQKHKTFWVNCGAPNPSIKVIKTANPTTYSSTGTSINYTYVITNTGNVTLTNVTLSDNKLTTLNDASACTLNSGDTSTTLGTLDPGDIETCHATYSTVQSDLNNGSITNIATATGTPPTGPSVQATSTAVVNYVPTGSSPSTPPPVSSPSSAPPASSPTLTITKSASPTTITAGSDSEYVINAAATGLVQGQVVVTDPLSNYQGVTYALVSLPTPLGDTAWSSCGLLTGNAANVSEVVQCTFTPPSGGVSNVIFAPIAVRVTTSTSTPSQVLANIASIAYGGSSIASNRVTITIQPALAPQSVSSSSSGSSSPPQPSTPSASHQPATAVSSSVVVPSAHTGEPWSSLTWWGIVIGSGIAGAGLLLMSLRRRSYLP